MFAPWLPMRSPVLGGPKPLLLPRPGSPALRRSQVAGENKPEDEFASFSQHRRQKRRRASKSRREAAFLAEHLTAGWRRSTSFILRYSAPRILQVELRRS